MRSSIEIFISAICNLHCKYCYIPKTKAMLQIQQKLIKLPDVLEKLPDKHRVEYFGLWGAEPTLSSDIAIRCIEKALKIFPNLREVSFSTNGTNLDALIRISNTVLAHNLNLEVQFSIDGPEYLNGMNRQPGILNIVIENMQKYLDHMNNQEFSSNLLIRLKPTLTIDNMKFLLENDLISDTMSFFEHLSEDMTSKIQKDNIHFIPSYHFTLEVPGKYTKHDGLIFSRFLSKLHSISPSTYTYRFLRIMDFPFSLSRIPSMFTCSGGDSNMGLDHNGAMHICHRTFMLNEAIYLQEILKMPEYQNWDVSLLEKDVIDLLNKYFIVPIDDNERVMKMSYATRCYHDFWRIKLASATTLIRELALAEQINSVYVNDDIATLLALFLHTAFSCPMENILNTSCIEVIPVSLIRLWGNGAFRELLRDVYRRTE